MTIRFMGGDCRAVLARLPADSVHMVCTSPPYWGLRDYGIPPSVWGGDAACEHVWGGHSTIRKGSTNGRGDLGSTLVSVGAPKTLAPGLQNDHGETKQYRTDASAFCRCGAWRGAHGLEPTVDLYVRNAVEIFRAVHRVLRPDGTLWLNLGDTYASNWGMGAIDRKSSWWSTRSGELEGKGWGNVKTAIPPNSFKKGNPNGLKAKDLIGIPWRIAFALQADGWWLRQDIIWAKPNPMPESVTDRCTKAHEYLFLLTKSARYFYDAEAIRDEPTGRTDPIVSFGASKAIKGRLRGGRDRTGGGMALDGLVGRNKRSVWTVATSPFPEAHFATFPPKLIEPCIKAGCPEGGTVLDPFAGAGTTGLVADRLQRNAILIELNAKYIAMARRRIANDRRRKPKVKARRSVSRPAPPQLRIAACRR